MATATREFSSSAKELGDKIVTLTLKEAKELSDYLEEVHGIKAAAGGGGRERGGQARGRTVRLQSAVRNALSSSASLRQATARWLTRSFCSARSSPKVAPLGGCRNTGS